MSTSEARYAGLVGVADQIRDWPCLLADEAVARLEFVSIVSEPNFLCTLTGHKRGVEPWHAEKRYLLRCCPACTLIVNGTGLQTGLWKKQIDSENEDSFFVVEPSLFASDFRFKEGVVDAHHPDVKHYVLLGGDVALHILSSMLPRIEALEPQGTA